MARDLLVTIADLRGGRNGTDPPLSLPDNQAVEVLNIDWREGTIGSKRRGSDAVATTGGTAFSGVLSGLFRFVPGLLEAFAELWAIDAAPLVKRYTAALGTFANVTLDDAMLVSDGVVSATLNGKLFLAYTSAVDRLHVYDPSLASPRVRRVGIAPGTDPPTVANSAVGGTVPAELAYWRVRWTQIVNGVTVRRSEPTPSVVFTPDGAHDNIVITRPTPPGEGETHWELEVSLDNAVWSVLYTDTTLPIATTVAGFSGSPSAAFPILPISDLIGTYSLFPSVGLLLSDGNRLLGAQGLLGGGLGSSKSSRIYYTPVLGSTDQGDDERVPQTTKQKNYVDLNENDGGGLTGLGGPVDGSVWAFKGRQIWKLTPTGVDTAPYVTTKRTDGVGCIAHKSIVVAEDDAGAPALYFMSHKGPYRLSAAGLQYLGHDNEDLWRTLNLEADVVSHAVWHADMHQVWFWVATGSDTAPGLKMIFDVKLGHVDGMQQVRGGWARHDGPSAAARCSVMAPNTLSTGGRALKPYIGRASGTALWKCDTTSLDDAGTAIQAYVITKPLPAVEALHRRMGTQEPHVLAKAQASTSLSVVMTRDFGKEARSAAVDLSPAGGETRVIRKLEGLEMADAHFVQVTVGDTSAVANTWTVDSIAVPVRMQEAG